MFSFLYDLFLGFYFLIQTPFLIRRLSTDSKTWKGLKSRVVGPWPKKQKEPSIWIHAVSLGESKAILPILEKLQKEYPQKRIICTVQSDTGYDFLSKQAGIEVYYAPVDISWVQKAFIDRIHPELLILSEGDLWYHQLKMARQKGSKIVLLSAKLSQKTSNLYAKFPWIARKFLKLDAIGVQNTLYYNRFANHMSDLSVLSITGNLKIAGEPKFSFQEKVLKERLGISNADYGITIASTHECEEEGILAMIEETLRAIPSAKFFIAPRHPVRFLPFYEKIQKRLQEKAVLFSQLTTEEWKVCLVDQMGILSDFFRISKISIVAGSFDPSIGGHNLIEPIQAGSLVLFGPHVQNQVEFQDLILSNKAGCEVSLDAIPALLKEIHDDPARYEMMLKSGKEIAKTHAQIKEKNWKLVIDHLPPQIPLKIL